MKKLILALIVISSTSIAAEAISKRTEARDLAKAQRNAERQREVDNAANIAATKTSIQETNQKLDNLESRLEQIYEQQAVTNVLLRQLIKVQGAE